MRSLFLTYRLILLAAVSVSMLLLLKINKRSFYFHYFKVIEEVEMRNSQALHAETFSIQVWRSQLQEAASILLPILTALFAFGLFLLPFPESWIASQAGEQVLIPVREPQYLRPPVRAP